MRLRDVVEGVVWKPISELDTLLVHVVPPKVEEEPEEEETTAEAAAASEAGDEPDAEKKTDEGEASDGDEYLLGTYFLRGRREVNCRARQSRGKVSWNKAQHRV